MTTYIKSLPKASVSIREKTYLVLKLYESARLAHESEKRAEHSELKAGSDMVIAGLWGLGLKWWESVFAKRVGAFVCDLPLIDHLDFDSRSDCILDGYTEEINTIFIKKGKSAEEILNLNAISSPILLFRVLILRLMHIALCDKMTAGRDGEIVLKIIKTFITNMLKNSYEFSLNSQSIINYFASIDHDRWFNQIEKIIKIVKELNSHRDTFSQAMTFFKSINYSIMRFISARLYLVIYPEDIFSTGKRYLFDHLTIADFDDQFIRQTLGVLEEQLAKSVTSSIESANAIHKMIGLNIYGALENIKMKSTVRTDKTLLSNCANQNMVCTDTTAQVLEELDATKSNHIKAILATQSLACYPDLVNLYTIFFRSKGLLIALEQVANIINICSWVPIISGKVPLAELAALIASHSAECQSIMGLRADDPIKNLFFASTITASCFEARQEIQALELLCIKLASLQSPDLVGRINTEIAQNIDNLEQVGNCINICLVQHNLEDDKKSKQRISMETAQRENAASTSVMINKVTVEEITERAENLTMQRSARPTAVQNLKPLTSPPQSGLFCRLFGLHYCDPQSQALEKAAYFHANKRLSSTGD